MCVLDLPGHGDDTALVPVQFTLGDTDCQSLNDLADICIWHTDVEITVKFPVNRMFVSRASFFISFVYGSS